MARHRSTKARTGFRLLLASVVCLSASAACDGFGEPDGEPEDSSFLAGTGRADGYGVEFGPADARGVLLLVNTASFELLHHGASVHEPAARNIVEHRAGPDGVPGTGDDRLLESLEELDAIPYVGPVAFNRLLSYAREFHYVLGYPRPTIQGIEKNGAEGRRILDVVNGYSFEAMDQDIGLDKRAARNIVDSRPIAGLGELWTIPYVGPSAFEKLSGYSRDHYLVEVVGHVWRDSHGAGDFEAGAGLKDFVVFAGESGLGEYSEDLLFAVTNADGMYRLWLDRGEGRTRITQALPFGWSNTFAGTIGDLSGSVTWTSGPDNETPRIVGGEDADIEDFPFMVGLVDSYRPWEVNCGGALVASNYVLTAAHCVDFIDTDEIIVRWGTDDVNDDRGGGVDVKEIVYHPEYSKVTSGYDIAFLELSEPLMVPRVPILDEDRRALSSSGVVATTMGWGTLSHGWFAETPDRLQKVEVPIVSEEQCAEDLAHMDVENFETQLCAGYPDGGRDACQGDSGGPLVVPDETGRGWIHAGVVSWGDSCAQPGLPGVYARTSHFHGWLLENMKPETSDHVEVEWSGDQRRVEASFANFR